MTTPCPSCGAPASGHFCSSCGTALAGAACVRCAAPLTPGAHYCHRCGTPAGASVAPARGLGALLPWAVAAIALLALIALVVGQRFGGRSVAVAQAGVDTSAAAAAPFAGGAPGASGMPRAPDISQLTPEQRAERLYDRIMTEAQAGKIENVQSFLPMAIAAYEMIAPLNLDQRYDLGSIGVVGGDSALARAQADTILSAKPTHLLGLILEARAARLEKNEVRAKKADARLLAAESTERAAGLKEYLLHKNDIDAALTAARSTRR